MRICRYESYAQTVDPNWSTDTHQFHLVQHHRQVRCCEQCMDELSALACDMTDDSNDAPSESAPPTAPVVLPQCLVRKVVGVLCSVPVLKSSLVR